MKLIVFLLLVVLSGCRQTIQHGLDEAQANEIEFLLTSAGIEARKAREKGRDARWAIEVPDDRTATALRLLSENDLPHERAPGFAEVFGKGSMVPTAIEENAMYLHALSGELSRTLAAVEGVATARVHLVAQPNGPSLALRPSVRPRASVLLKVHGAKAETIRRRTSELQSLVAGSVDGLDVANVSVMLSELPQATPDPESVFRHERPSRVPLLVAACLVALLSGALTLSILHGRRLHLTRPSTDSSLENESRPIQAVSHRST
jgi:type III secretion protein J